MGTSLADRAWGAESAVYRVAGVLNVIGGWFMTALVAFIASGTILTLISFRKRSRNSPYYYLSPFYCWQEIYINYNKKSKELKAEDRLERAESSSIQGVIEESANNISNVIKTNQ